MPHMSRVVQVVIVLIVRGMARGMSPVAAGVSAMAPGVTTAMAAFSICYAVSAQKGEEHGYS